MLSRDQIDDVLDRVDLKSLAEQFGAEFRPRKKYGSCPLCGGGKSTTRFEIKDARTWVCAACGQGGDAIALVRQLRGLSFEEAIASLGAPQQLDREASEKLAQKRAARQAKAEAEAAKYREKVRRVNYQAWKAAVPFIGTPVEAYLRLRGITWQLERLRLKFAADAPYFDGMTLDDVGRARHVVIHRGPAMLAAFVGADGRFLGLHRTWIDLGQPKGKAVIADPDSGEILPAKKMRGTKQGGFLDVTSGYLRSIVAGEGIETVLSVREAMRDEASYRVAGDLGNLVGPAVESIAHPECKHARSCG